MSKKSKIKPITHTIMKNEDVVKYLTNTEIHILQELLDKISQGRLREGKKLNEYYSVNTDEPYAQEVLDLILTREYEKEQNKGVWKWKHQSLERFIKS